MSKREKEKSQPYPGLRKMIEGFSALKELLLQVGARFDNDRHPGSGSAIAGERSAILIEVNANNDIDDYLQDKTFAFTPVVVFRIVAGEFTTARLDIENFPQFYPANVQELLDFTLIAFHLSEQILSPVIINLDKYRCGEQWETIQFPEKELTDNFLGAPSDQVSSISESQKMRLGDVRRRIPKLLDSARPIMVGSEFPEALQYKSIISRKLYLEEDSESILEAGLQELSQLTGRQLTPLFTKNNKPADVSFLSYGPILQQLTGFIERNNSVKTGVICISILNPFPGAALSHLLKGKETVLVLEPLSSTVKPGMLITEIRNILGKSLENANGRWRYPQYAVIKNTRQFPALYSAYFSNDYEAPGERGFLACLDYIKNKENSSSEFFLGRNGEIPDYRYPKLLSLQTRLKQVYPRETQQLDTLIVELTAQDSYRPAKRSAKQVNQNHFSVECRMPHSKFSAYGMAAFLETHVSVSGEDSSLTSQPYFNGKHEAHRYIGYCGTDQIAANLHRDIEFIDSLQNTLPLCDIKLTGKLLIASALSPAKLWSTLPAALRNQIRNRELQLYSIDPAGAAIYSNNFPGMRNIFESQYYYGGLLSLLHGGVDSELKTKYLDYFTALISFPDVVSEKLGEAFQAGTSSVSRIDWEQLRVDEPAFPPEKMAPVSLRKTAISDRTIFDASRFWDSVSYLLEAGDGHLIAADPFLGCGTIPAGSSEGYDHSEQLTQLPLVVAENCNGCALCWARCPDSAITPSIQSVSALTEKVFDLTKTTDADLSPLQRYRKQLAKITERLFSADELARYVNLGELLNSAGNELVERLNPSPDDKEAIQAAVGLLAATAGALPVIRTERFFEIPQQSRKGSGMALIIGIDPEKCQSCGACISVCPENAIVKSAPEADLVAEYRKNGALLSHLPTTALENLTSYCERGTTGSPLNYFLNRTIQRSLLGGVAGETGSGIYSAMRLLLAAATVARGRMEKPFRDLIESTAEQLQSTIQGKLNETVSINDFDAFTKRLNQINPVEQTGNEIFAVLSQGNNSQTLDKQTLKTSSGHLEKIIRLRKKYTTTDAHSGRAPLTLFINNPGRHFRQAAFPYNSFPYPTLVQQRLNVETILGVFQTLFDETGNDNRLLNAARAFLNGESVSSNQQILQETKRLTPAPLLVFNSEDLDGVALSAIARLLSAKLPVKIAVISHTLLNEQPDEKRSLLASTLKTINGGLALWGISFEDVFVLQGSAAFPEHLFDGVISGVEYGGPALFHIYASVPEKQGILPDQAAEQEKRAIASRAFPLLNYDPGQGKTVLERLSLSENPAETDDWFLQEYHTPDGHAKSQALTAADYLFRDGRYFADFSPVPGHETTQNLLPVGEYLNLSREKRKGYQPVVVYRGTAKTSTNFLVSARIVKYCDLALGRWRLYQELAGISGIARQRLQEKLEEKFETQLDAEKEMISKKMQAQVEAYEKEHQQRYHKVLTEKLLALYRNGSKNMYQGKRLDEFLQSVEGDE